MSIMPADGWESPAPIRDLQREDVVCPSCHSSDWKTATMTHQEGLSVGVSTTSGSAIGVARTGLREGQYSFGGGVYKGRTVNVSQTVLSRKAAPPPKRTGLVVFLGVLLIFFGWACVAGLVRNGPDLGSIVCGALAVVLLLALIKTQARQQEVYEERVAVYRATRVCQRCGTFYTVSDVY